MKTQSETSSTNKKFSWIKYGLMFGGSMYVYKFIVSPFIFDEEISLVKALVGIPFWLLGGLAFGYLTKLFNKNNESKS